MSGLTTTEGRNDALQFVENPDPHALESALAMGNLAELNPPQRLQFLAAICRSTGLNPLTRPFEFINLQGKLVLYARKDCTDQLRNRDKVSITDTRTQIAEGVMIVTVTATLPSGRSDSDVGAVYIGGMKGADLAIATMKAVTKAKRRVTLSICGLGFLDESEIEDAQAAAPPQNAPSSNVEKLEKLHALNRRTNQDVTEVVTADVDRSNDPPPQPVNEALRDFLTLVREAETCDHLTKLAADSNGFADTAERKIAKGAVMKRSKVLHFQWEEDRFFPEPQEAGGSA